MKLYDCVGVAFIIVLVCYNYVPEGIKSKADTVIKQVKQAIAKSKQATAELEENILEAEKHADKIKDELQGFIDTSIHNNQSKK